MKEDGWMKENDPQRETGYTQERYAARRPVLLWLVVLIGLMAPAALLASAHTPETDAVSTQIALWMGGEEERGKPVAGLMEIEDAWAIEDMRTEAAEPLVSRMFRDDAALGFDRESRTFYCTLGMVNAEEWPDVTLTAMGEEGVRASWIDDYTYDFCADAIAEGYRYELLAYTDTEFEYIGVVFTGLPIVTVHTDDGAQIVPDADVGADVHIASDAYGALYSRALVHKRGGGAYVGVPKDSMRLEFRGIDARGKEKKIERSVLGMEADTDWLLIGNSSDFTAIRSHLCWEKWKDWNPGLQFAELESRLVEVFRGDEYMGIYQLMQYVDPQKELTRMGGNPDTDAMVRMITMRNDGDRPRLDRVDWDNHQLELRHAPKNMSAGETFAIYEPFSDVEILRTDEMSDEEFTQIMETHFDVQNLLEYFLFVQMYNLRDNARNNLYIWALKQADGAYVYQLSPWDMDRSLCKLEAEGVMYEPDYISWELPMINRMLGLDIGDSQKRLYDLHREKREGELSDDAIYQWLTEAEDMVNASGAYLRESEKWRGGAQTLDLTELRSQLISLQGKVDMHIREVWCPAVTGK